VSEETIPQMRETIDSLTKQLKDANKTNGVLATENRVLKARDVFGSQGYDPAGGELFAAQNPDGDITEEAVTAFVDKYGVGKKAPADTSETEVDEGKAGESGSEGAPGSAELGTLSRGGSRAGEGGAGGSTGEPMTRAEWQALHNTDPAAARAAVRQGRVQVSKDNFYVGGNSQVGNPYAKSEQ